MNSVIIAGSRGINNYDLIKSAILESGFKIDEIVSGLANGPDKLGKRYGLENNIPVIEFPAEWNTIDNNEPCKIKTNKFGRPYNVFAGHNRNRKMAEYSNFLILIWDGKSPGSRNMKNLAKQYGLTIFEKVLE